MIFTSCVVEEEKNENSSLNYSINENEDQELAKIIELQKSKLSFFLLPIIEMKEKSNKEKPDNFVDGIIDMNVSNLSKIEVKNSSINSSGKSLSRFEEQKDMIDLLDNQFSVNIYII